MFLKIINKLVHPYVRLGVILGMFPICEVERHGYPVRPHNWPSWLSPVPKIAPLGPNDVSWVSIEETIGPDETLSHEAAGAQQSTSGRKQAHTEEEAHQTADSAQQEPAHHTTMPDKSKVQGWVDDDLKQQAKTVAEQRGQSLSELVGNAVRKEVHQHQFEVLNDEYNLEEEIVELSRAAAEKASEELKEDIRRTLREEQQQEDLPR